MLVLREAAARSSREAIVRDVLGALVTWPGLLLAGNACRLCVSRSFALVVWLGVGPLEERETAELRALVQARARDRGARRETLRP